MPLLRGSKGQPRKVGKAFPVVDNVHCPAPKNKAWPHNERIAHLPGPAHCLVKGKGRAVFRLP